MPNNVNIKYFLIKQNKEFDFINTVSKFSRIL